MSLLEIKLLSAGRADSAFGSCTKRIRQIEHLNKEKGSDKLGKQIKSTCKEIKNQAWNKLQTRETKQTNQTNQNAENVKEITETAFSWSLFICFKDDQTKKSRHLTSNKQHRMTDTKSITTTPSFDSPFYNTWNRYTIIRLSMNLYLCLRFMAIHIHQTSLFLSSYIKMSLSFSYARKLNAESSLEWHIQLLLSISALLAKNLKNKNKNKHHKKSHKTHNIVSSSGHWLLCFHITTFGSRKRLLSNTVLCPLILQCLGHIHILMKVLKQYSFLNHNPLEQTTLVHDKKAIPKN